MRLIPAAAAALMLAAAPPALARNFTWSFAADILTLDPHSSNNTFTNAFLDNVFETLVRHNPRLEIEPALATQLGGASRPPSGASTCARACASTAARPSAPRTWCSPGSG